MIYYKTLRNIRKEYGLTQEQLAQKLGCTPEYIQTLETPKKEGLAPPEFVQTLREKMGLQDALITEAQREALMERLHRWKIMIDYGALDKAKEALPKLEQDTKSTFSRSTSLLLDLYTASYYRAKGDLDACYKLTDELSKYTNEFNARHFYLYHRLEGVRAYSEGRFRDAVNVLARAEKLDRHLKQGEVGFYYLYGMCLSDMGYVAGAIENLKRAKHLATWNKIYNGEANKRYDYFIDGYLAYNLSKFGESEEAFKILHRRLSLEKKSGKKQAIGYTYHSIGSVYLMIKKYDEAVFNFDKAFSYLEKSSGAYKSALFRKTVALYDNGKMDACRICAERGMSLCSEDDMLWRAMFDGYVHLTTLHSPESVKHMEKSVIPILEEYNHYEVAADFYLALSNSLKQSGDYERALNYCTFALETYKRLYEERMEGGAE